MFFSQSLPLEGKKILGFFSQWYAKVCIFEIQDCKPFGTGWDFSQDYIGIGYCGVEGDYGFIYDLEPFARFRPFSLQGGWWCYMVNWWGPIAHRQGVYLLEAVVLPELLF